MRLQITCGLCAGRHDIPGVDKFIFPQVVADPMDFDALQKQANDFFVACGCDSGTHDGVSVTLFVTGLTPCLVAAINVCIGGGFGLTLMHFDRVSGTFKPQQVVQCPDWMDW